MGTPTTKNLGLVKAIHVGNNPPVNILMLWYNTNPMINQHYYYDVITASWVSLAGGSILAINVSYDNSISLLTATNVQAAIDELDSILDGLSFAASNITYDPSGSGLTSTNVQDAIDEVVGLIPTVSYPVTNGSNGVYLSGTTIRLGTNALIENTTINTSTFYLDLFGNLRFRPSTLSATSQNKSIQLANTTGVVSLVNNHMYAKRSGSLTSGLHSILINVADGLTPTIGTNTAQIANYGTIDYSVGIGIQSSKINNSTTNDFSLFGAVPAPTNIVGQKIEWKHTVTVISNFDAIIFPFVTHVFVTPFFLDIGPFAGKGLPTLIAGRGYREGKFCKAGEATIIESSFIFLIENNGYENFSGLALYRNKGIAATDGVPITVEIVGWSAEFKTLKS